MDTMNFSQAAPLTAVRTSLRQKSANLRGFTLVELLIVIAIIAILSMMATAALSKFRTQAKVSRCVSEIRGLETDISAFAVENSNYPPGLTSLRRTDIKDPWGNDYRYRAFTATLMRYDSGSDDINTDFDLYSIGADGLTDLSIIHADSLDDVVRGRNGSFVGLTPTY